MSTDYELYRRMNKWLSSHWTIAWYYRIRYELFRNRHYKI